MDKESIRYLGEYINVTDEICQKIEKHIRRYGLNGGVCAWYDGWEDFCDDWCGENIGYTRTEARKLLHNGTGEFMVLSDGLGIIRFDL